MGQDLQNEGVSAVALKTLEDNLGALNASSRSVAMQFCQPNYTSEHIFGFFATSNRTFAPVQQAVQSWSSATCLSFPNSQNFSGQAMLTIPIMTTSEPNIAIAGANSISFTALKRSSSVKLYARSECSTIQVHSGDSCGSLAKKCGISGNGFTKYNNDDDLCSSLTPGQHVCCSTGDLPDFKPQPNADGSCHVYNVPKNENCAKIAAANSLTKDDLEEFNKNTWAWNGCENLQYNMNICLSKGDPPMPATLSNAVCGPQDPGTKRPTDDTKLADLNPCPLNACCDVWGQCGITAEFCTDTATDNPDTAEPSTNGCISNCGTNIVRVTPPPPSGRLLTMRVTALSATVCFRVFFRLTAPNTLTCTSLSAPSHRTTKLKSVMSCLRMSLRTSNALTARLGFCLLVVGHSRQTPALTISSAMVSFRPTG